MPLTVCPISSFNKVVARVKQLGEAICLSSSAATTKDFAPSALWKEFQDMVAKYMNVGDLAEKQKKRRTILYEEDEVFYLPIHLKVSRREHGFFLSP
jgi:hypothetical protein